MSNIVLNIPDAVAGAISLPERRKEIELRRELAVALYREELLSFGKARDLAEMDHYAFSQLLGNRQVERHYGEEELEDDMRYSRDSA